MNLLINSEDESPVRVIDLIKSDKDELQSSLNVLDRIEPLPPIERFIDVTCWCSGATKYAFTPHMCLRCEKWRNIMNYYSGVYTSPVKDMGRLTMVTRSNYGFANKTISDSLDPMSCELYCSEVMRKTLDGYPATIDCWTCGRGRCGTIVREATEPFSNALKIKTAEDISYLLNEQLQMLKPFHYMPSALSYHRSEEHPRTIADCFSYNSITDTVLLPIPASISFNHKGYTKHIRSDLITPAYTYQALEDYIREKRFVELSRRNKLEL